MKNTVCLCLSLVWLAACSPAPSDPLQGTYSEKDAFKGLYDGRGYSIVDPTSMATIVRAVTYNELHGISSEGSTFGSLLKQGRLVTSPPEDSTAR